MVVKSWGTTYQLFDKKTGSRIRDLMYDEKNINCLFPGGDAKAKIAEYKKLSDQDHYLIYRDFFQFDE